MSLVLPVCRPVPVRGVLIVALVLSSVLGLAPTLAAVRHAAVCKCLHCPGEAFCCCGAKSVCVPGETK